MTAHCRIKISFEVEDFRFVELSFLEVFVLLLSNIL